MGSGELVLEEEEEKIFHSSFEERGEKEGALARAKARLGAFGALLQSKLPGAAALRRRG